MKLILAAALLLAVCYQATAGVSCPNLTKVYEEIIKCATEIESATSEAELCREFTNGGCTALHKIYAKKCEYDDNVYRDLKSTMKDVSGLCKI